MNSILPFIVSGIVTGAIYGLAATGLVVTYKTSGIFNFGHGAIATLAAYAFYYMHVSLGWSWELSLIVSVLVGGPLMGLLMQPAARRLASLPTIYKVSATIGLIVGVQGLAVIWYGPDTRFVEQYLPGSMRTFELLGVHISYSQLILTVVGLIAVAAFYLVLQFTRTGVAMRAVVDDPDLLALQGTDPVRVRRIAWMIGSTFAALSGVLILPLIGLDPVLLTFLVVQAFGAAAIGRFSNIPLTFAGALLIGILANLSSKYSINFSWLSGLPSSLPFIILLIVLLVTPRKRLVVTESVKKLNAVNYRGPIPLRITAAVVWLVPLALVPLFAGNNIGFFSLALTQMILLLSLGMLVRTSGQVSLCHAAFMAIGACAFSQFTVQLHLPWLVALLLGAFVVVPVGALVAIPAIRLSGPYLALATFGFGLMVASLFYPLSFMFGLANTGRAMPLPSIATTPKAFYFVILACVVVTALITTSIHATRFGRILRGIADAPVALSTLGLSTNVTRVIVFCISAFLAGVSGILYGASVGFSSASDPRFQPTFSLIILVALIVAPFGEPWYIIPGAIGALLPAYWISENSTNWINVLFGVSAVVVALMGGHRVMPERLRVLLDRAFTWPARVAGTAVPVPGSAPAPSPATRQVARPAAALCGDPADGRGRGLEVRALKVHFGGLVAVNGLTMAAPLRRVTGLIGPNGAGKTTTFNACSGLVAAASGQILLHGADITRASPAARARGGLGRTFQRMDLCDNLTVSENVALGRESGQAGGRVFSQLAASRGQRRTTLQAVGEALELCDLTQLAHRQAGGLSTGQRRLVELARCLAGDFDVLMLDEPSSGLDRAETEHLGMLILRVLEERGCGILLVEHDISLVTQVCSHIYVLDFGQLIFEGDAQAMSQSTVVSTAYLGDHAGSSEVLDEAASGEPR